MEISHQIFLIPGTLGTPKIQKKQLNFEKQESIKKRVTIQPKIPKSNPKEILDMNFV